MSFFSTSDNQAIKPQSTFDLGGGDFEPIPNDTQAHAMIDEAKWDSYEGDEYISLRWTVIDGDYKGRKIFQKVRVKDADPKKSDKSKQMLVAIDFNAGGGLMRAGVEPDDMSLMINLVNKPMHIVLAVWEINDKKGNWVKSVSGKAQEQKPAPQHTKFDDDIAF
jgi:hypothetical protein